jgi:hypothetical protein
MNEVMTKAVRIAHRQELLVDEREIRYGSSTEALSVRPPACEMKMVAGRMSGLAIMKLLQSVGIDLDQAMMGGWQLGRDEDGMMVLCKE